MSDSDVAITLRWCGPYAWPGFESENDLPAMPAHPGCYLWTVPYEQGFLIYAAGITRRPIPTRFSEHQRNYLSGDYTVLDLAAMSRGERVEIWHGWGWNDEKRVAFKARQTEIVNAARRQLRDYHLFVADVDLRPRLLERLEAAVMEALYRQSAPLCDIPDKGMQLAPRWSTEVPIVVVNQCGAVLHGLPVEMEI